MRLNKFQLQRFFNQCVKEQKDYRIYKVGFELCNLVSITVCNATDNYIVMNRDCLSRAIEIVSELVTKEDFCGSVYIECKDGIVTGWYFAKTYKKDNMNDFVTRLLNKAMLER